MHPQNKCCSVVFLELESRHAKKERKKRETSDHTIYITIVMQYERQARKQLPFHMQGQLALQKYRNIIVIS